MFYFVILSLSVLCFSFLSHLYILLSLLSCAGEARTIRGEKTKYVDINPKAVKTEELYGYISMATREWKDGLLSKIMRDLGK